MRKLSLDAVAREQLKQAKENSNKRSAKTVYGGHEHSLRQSVIALAGGAVMADHISPGEATLQVLQGRIRLTAGKDTWDLRSGGCHAFLPNSIPIRRTSGSDPGGSRQISAPGQ